ncbi:MAG: IS6 family transposase [Pleurocapsa sp. SU_196_0]|nr:IS6 family transposase [Pleurocapsa sp. SU_196_0]
MLEPYSGILASQIRFSNGSGKLLGEGKPMPIDQKLPGYRSLLSIIGHAVWMYHRYALSYRDVEEILFKRGIEVSRESIRTWGGDVIANACVFSPVTG